MPGGQQARSPRSPAFRTALSLSHCPCQEGQEEKWAPGDGRRDLAQGCCWAPGFPLAAPTGACPLQSLGGERHLGLLLLSSEGPFSAGTHNCERPSTVAGKGFYLPAPVWPPLREGEQLYQ